MPRKSGAKSFAVPTAARKEMAQFVRKLVELLETAPPAVVSWTRGGTAFRVHDQKGFSAVLGRHFRSCQLNNFVRQLNFYAFQKAAAMPAGGANNTHTHTTVGSLEFTHPLFRRGDWASITQIKRKTSSEFHVTYEHELKALRETQAQLQGAVGDLKAQLAAALAQVATLRCERDQSVAHAAAVTDVAASAGVKLPAALVAAATRRLAQVRGGMTTLPRRFKPTPTPVRATQEGAGEGEGEEEAEATCGSAPTPAPRGHGHRDVAAEPRRRSRKRQRTVAPPAALADAVPGGGDVEVAAAQPEEVEEGPVAVPRDGGMWGAAPAASSDFFALFAGDPVEDAFDTTATATATTDADDASMTGEAAQGDDDAGSSDALDAAFTDLSWLDGSGSGSGSGGNTDAFSLAPPRLLRGWSCESVPAVVDGPLSSITAPAVGLAA